MHTMLRMNGSLQKKNVHLQVHRDKSCTLNDSGLVIWNRGSERCQFPPLPSLHFWLCIHQVFITFTNRKKSTKERKGQASGWRGGGVQ